MPVLWGRKKAKKFFKSIWRPGIFILDFFWKGVIKGAWLAECESVCGRQLINYIISIPERGSCHGGDLCRRLGCCDGLRGSEGPGRMKIASLCCGDERIAREPYKFLSG